MGLRAFFLLVLLVLAPGALAPAFAVQPDEILADSQLEQRARNISAGLRCLVCQNQSIDDSDATLAKDLRVLVREHLQAGDSDEQIRKYLVARYGNFILLKPPFAWDTALLWLSPFVLLALGGAAILSHSRRKRSEKPAAPLSADESEKLKSLLGASGGDGH
ncbi:cytochrome c-type biogenesis protein [uncultured Rhodoblastus sp.]|uniref:cytochrome c-type biogenesis protein n=1 Tax=uncultured Rhodoblastus sp. TaxID=543037 RepID=UPI0025ED8346|nr:cytochrome c-type biogenesis protein [uncultured Rhodoblastus sp.]